MATSYLEAYQDHCNADYGPEDLDQLNDVGALSGQLVLSASELADRLEDLPSECGGREVVAALRMMDPDTGLLVTSDGPVALAPEEKAITKGFWWARNRESAEFTVIKVFTHDWREPDDDGYGELQGIVVGRDHSDEVSTGPFALVARYDFLSRIPEPV